jgi:23S rRNA pseudouridine2605 synthase
MTLPPNPGTAARTARRSNRPDAAKRPAAPRKPAAPRTPAAAADGPPREGERIAKLLARAGIASRVESRTDDRGRPVKLNDEVLTTPATVLKNLKGVTVDGKAVAAAEPAACSASTSPPA